MKRFISVLALVLGLTTLSGCGGESELVGFTIINEKDELFVNETSQLTIENLNPSDYEFSFVEDIGISENLSIDDQGVVKALSVGQGFVHPNITCVAQADVIIDTYILVKPSEYNSEIKTALTSGFDLDLPFIDLGPHKSVYDETSKHLEITGEYAVNYSFATAKEALSDSGLVISKDTGLSVTFKKTTSVDEVVVKLEATKEESKYQYSLDIKIQKEIEVGDYPVSQINAFLNEIAGSELDLTIVPFDQNGYDSIAYTEYADDLYAEVKLNNVINSYVSDFKEALLEEAVKEDYFETYRYEKVYFLDDENEERQYFDFCISIAVDGSNLILEYYLENHSINWPGTFLSLEFDAALSLFPEPANNQYRYTMAGTIASHKYVAVNIINGLSLKSNVDTLYRSVGYTDHTASILVNEAAKVTLQLKDDGEDLQLLFKKKTETSTDYGALIAQIEAFYSIDLSGMPNMTDATTTKYALVELTSVTEFCGLVFYDSSFTTDDVNAAFTAASYTSKNIGNYVFAYVDANNTHAVRAISNFMIEGVVVGYRLSIKAI